MLRPEQILPTTIITISVSASIGYAFVTNWRMAIYWISAAILNAAVTY